MISISNASLIFFDISFEHCKFTFRAIISFSRTFIVCYISYLPLWCLNLPFLSRNSRWVLYRGSWFAIPIESHEKIVSAFLDCYLFYIDLRFFFCCCGDKDGKINFHGMFFLSLLFRSFLSSSKKSCLNLIISWFVLITIIPSSMLLNMFQIILGILCFFFWCQKFFDLWSRLEDISL